MNIFQHITNRSLAHAVRFSSTPQHFHESVAEHSFYTAYITSLLVNLLEQAGEKVDKEKAITMALVHDMDEALSGDILGPFKHYSKEVKEAIAKVNKELIHQVFADLPEELGAHYISLWNEEGSSETIEAEIVKIADRLSLLSKCAEEVKVGNEFFRKIYDWTFEILESYDASWWGKIKKDVLPPN